jgi:hypothetical protein
MDNDTYRPHIIDSEIEQYLRAFGAICIEVSMWFIYVCTAHGIQKNREKSQH